MIQKFLTTMILVLSTQVVLASAFGGLPSSPEGLVRELWQQIQTASTVPSEQEQFISESLRQRYDFQSFYKMALQDHWSQWTGSQKGDFDQRFEKYFLKSVSQKMNELPKQEVSFVVAGKRIQQNKAILEFREFNAKKDSEATHFKVFFSRVKNQWKIYDVEIDGALLSRNYRGMFNHILRKENFEGLMARLDRSLSPQGGHL